MSPGSTDSLIWRGKIRGRSACPLLCCAWHACVRLAQSLRAQCLPQCSWYDRCYLVAPAATIPNQLHAVCWLGTFACQVTFAIDNSKWKLNRWRARENFAILRNNWLRKNWALIRFGDDFSSSQSYLVGDRQWFYAECEWWRAHIHNHFNAASDTFFAILSIQRSGRNWCGMMSNWVNELKWDATWCRRCLLSAVNCLSHFFFRFLFISFRCGCVYYSWCLEDVLSSWERQIESNIGVWSTMNWNHLIIYRQLRETKY